MKVLVVDDDAKTTSLLRQGLEEEGYDVTECNNGNDALKLALTGNFDLVLLDIVMPCRDGLSVLSELRETDRQTPVILLTGRDPVSARVEGLTIGADDYLAKPYAFSELLARMRAVLRRATSRSRGDALEVDDFKLHLRSYSASRGGRRIELSMKEFLLLELLMKHQGEILTRRFIAERIWGADYDSERNVIDVTIRRLRAKIDDGYVRKIIHTARGLGYVVR